MREVLIFGNGLGRAIDNEYFDLSRALKDAWDDNEVLDDTGREMIRRCISPDALVDNEEIWPRGEHELDPLQKVVAACDLVRQFEREADDGWLTERGRKFPGAIRSFVHRAACYFHRFEGSLNEDFANSVLNHVIDSRSHIATLNYDDLLYRSLIGTPAFNGYSCLIDGFVGAFSSDNLDRHYPLKQAYYLHLHGSPIYITRGNGEIRKSSLSEIGSIVGHQNIHLVLTEVKHKPTIIASSPVLTEYWSRFDQALGEVEGVTIFGYGGQDNHLNALIRKHHNSIRIRVVHRSSDEPITTREDKWKKRLGSGDLEIVEIDNVLDFRDW